MLITSGQRVNDRWKRGILHFNAVFRLSRYDFRPSRYRRVNKTIILHRLPPPSLSLIRTYRAIPSKNMVRICREKYRSFDHIGVHSLSIAETSMVIRFHFAFSNRRNTNIFIYLLHRKKTPFSTSSRGEYRRNVASEELNPAIQKTATIYKRRGGTK